MHLLYIIFIDLEVNVEPWQTQVIQILGDLFVSESDNRTDKLTAYSDQTIQIHYTVY